MGNLPKNIAIVYDRANKWGGAERLIEQLRLIYPTAHLVTAVFHPKAAWAGKFVKIKTSFLQIIPFAKLHHDWFAWLTPLAFDSLDMSEYDLVISVTSADAKSVRTYPRTLHICYCLTPTRYLWSHHQKYFRFNWLRLIAAPVIRYLRMWDLYSSTRPDVYLTISNLVAGRIKSLYNHSAEVVYPASGLTRQVSKNVTKTHFLWVGRFVGYKHPDLVAELFSRLPYQLIMVGDGKLFGQIKSRNYPNITLTGEISDQQLAGLYQSAHALLMLHEEDFGLVALEAMSFGTPVVTISNSGAAELIKPGTNGYLISNLKSRELAYICQLLITQPLDPDTIRRTIANYSEFNFRQKFAKVVSRLWKAHLNTLSS